MMDANLADKDDVAEAEPEEIIASEEETETKPETTVETKPESKPEPEVQQPAPKPSHEHNWKPVYDSVKVIYRQGISAFGGISPTYRIALEKKPLSQAGKEMNFAARNVKISLMSINQGKRKRETKMIENRRI